MVWQPNREAEKQTGRHAQNYAMKIVGRKESKPIQSLNEQAVRKKTKKIISDSQQLLCVPIGKSNQI